MNTKLTITLVIAFVLGLIANTQAAIYIPSNDIGLKAYVANLTATCPEISDYTEVEQVRDAIIANVDSNTTFALTKEREALRTALFKSFNRVSTAEKLDLATTNAWISFTNNSGSVTKGLVFASKMLRKQVCFASAHLTTPLANAFMKYFDVIYYRSDNTSSTVIEIGGEFTSAAACMASYYATNAEVFNLTQSVDFKMVGISNTTAKFAERQVNISNVGYVILPASTDNKSVSFVTVSWSRYSALGHVFSKTPATPSVIVKFYNPAGTEVKAGKLSDKLVVTFNTTNGAFDATKRYTCAVENAEISNWDDDYCETIYQGSTGVTCSCSRIAAVTSFSGEPTPTFFWLIPVLIGLGLILLVSSIVIVLLGVVIHFSNNPEEKDMAMEPIEELMNKFKPGKKQASAKAPSTKTEDVV